MVTLTLTTEEEMNNSKHNQGAEQIWDQKSSIISLIMWLSVSPHLKMCVRAWKCIPACVHMHVCICMCICVIITMCAHVTHLWHFVKSSHMVSWCPQLTLPVFTESKLNNLPPANCYWVTSANSLNWQLMNNRKRLKECCAGVNNINSVIMKGFDYQA